MTFTKEQKAVLKKAIRHYGFDSQTDIAIEEMSELTKAIIKDRRYQSMETLENIYEEIADVLIIVEQLRLAFYPEAVDRFVRSKIARLEQRIGEKENGKQQEDN